MDKDSAKVELVEGASIQIIEDEPKPQPEQIIPGKNRADLRKAKHYDGFRKKSGASAKKPEHWLKQI